MHQTNIVDYIATIIKCLSNGRPFVISIRIECYLRFARKLAVPVTSNSTLMVGGVRNLHTPLLTYKVLCEHSYSNSVSFVVVRRL